MAASTAITLALVFYTIGVFGEARAGSLQKKHLILFWIGLACDTTGTTIMASIARSSHGAGSPLHAITGALAIVLMLFHAVWRPSSFSVATRRAVRASTSSALACG